MSVRFLTCIPYSCQVGKHVWVWFKSCTDKRLKCENCGTPQ